MLEPVTTNCWSLTADSPSAADAGLAWAAAQGRLGDAVWGGGWLLGPWTLHPLALLYALSGTLMISKTLRIPKL